jgi:hypothetical protein
MSVSPEARLAELEARVGTLEARIRSLESGSTSAATLPEVDIDGQHGDPVVRKDPKRWEGASFVGSPFSRCPPDYLRTMASFLQWRAGKERAEPAKAQYARYSMLDAARALAWAKRIEEGRGRAARGQPPPEPEPDRWSPDPEADSPWPASRDDEIPF